MKSLLLLVCLAAGASLAPAGEIFPGLNRIWRHHESPHFKLYSAQNDRVSREVLQGMELVQALMLREHGWRVRIPQKVTLFYFSDADDFNAYVPSSHSFGRYAGFAFNHPDRMILTLAPTYENKAAREIARRQYVQFLFRLMDQDAPSWYREAIAEFYCTARESGDQVELGRPPEQSLEVLKKLELVPLRPLLFCDIYGMTRLAQTHRQLFTAESWALLHYAELGPKALGEASRQELHRLAITHAVQLAPSYFFTELARIMGTDLVSLQSDLRAYVDEDRYRTRLVPRPALPEPAEYTVRDVPPRELMTQLAALALRIKQGGNGGLKIKELAEKEPTAELFELLGSSAYLEQRTDKAQEYWEQAFALGSTNPNLLNQVCRLKYPMVYNGFRLHLALPPASSADLREKLLLSIKAAPEQSTAYDLLAWAEGAAAEPDPAMFDLVTRNLDKVTDRPRTLLGLALVKFHQGETEAALALLDEVGRSTHDRWLLQGTELCRAAIEKRKPDPELFGPVPPISLDPLHQLQPRQGRR